MTTLSEWIESRKKRNLSIEWQTYPGTDIEVFFDPCAVLYRIRGEIYVVPRHSAPYIEPYTDEQFERVLERMRA